jgi:hypothetical protein
MKREVLKGLSMVTLIVVIAFVTAVASANAQSAKMMVSQIPFEFVVGDQTLPAGEYRISSSALSSALAIQSEKDTAIRLTNGTEPNKSNRRAKLVFHRYGNKYFLAEVWNGSDTTGRQLFKSRQQRAIERELSDIASKGEFASKTYATVVVAADRR